jgi:predicted MFS family arabinose efflux permease
MNNNTAGAESRAWFSVFSLALGAFALVAAEFLPIGILTLVAKDLNVSVGTAGVMVLIPGFMAALSAPLVVVASGKLDRRHLVLILMGLMVGSNVLAALAPNFAVIMVARVLLGIGLGGFWATGPSLGFRLVKEGSGTRATALVLSGVSAGTVLGLPVGAFVGDFVGWRWAFAGAAGVGALVFLFQLFVLPRIPAVRSFGFKDMGRILTRPMARVGVLAAVLVIAGHFGAYTFVSPFFLNTAHLQPALIAILLLAYGAAGFAGTFLAGILIPKGQVATLVGTVLSLGLILLVLPLVSGSVITVSVLFILWGLVWGATPMNLQSWMMKAWPEAPEAASAVLVSTIGFSIALGSFASGIVVDNLGVAIAIPLAGAVAVASGVFATISRGVASSNAAKLDAETDV